MLRILLALLLGLVSWAVVVGTAFDKDWVLPALWVCPVIAMAAAWRAPKLQMAILLPLILLTLLDVALKLRIHDYGSANGGYDDAGDAAAFMFHMVLACISMGLGVVGFLISLGSYNRFRKDAQIASG